jgi:hypothetical protein
MLHSRSLHGITWDAAKRGRMRSHGGSGGCWCTLRHDEAGTEWVGCAVSRISWQYCICPGTDERNYCQHEQVRPSLRGVECILSPLDYVFSCCVIRYALKQKQSFRCDVNATFRQVAATRHYPASTTRTTPTLRGVSAYRSRPSRCATPTRSAGAGVLSIELCSVLVMS